MVFSKVFFSFLIVWWRHRILGLLLRVYSKRPNFGFSYRLSFGFPYYSTIRSDSVWYCWVWFLSSCFCMTLCFGSWVSLSVMCIEFWIVVAFLDIGIFAACGVWKQNDRVMAVWWIHLRRTSNGSRQLPDEHKHSHAEAQAHTINK